MKLEKLHYVDAIRGVAILLVIMRHAAQQGAVALSHFFSVLFSLGASGVQLFFMASAFTLYRSYRNRQGIESHATRNFFIRRFFRIAPLYYLAILYFVFYTFFNVPYWFGEQPYLSSYNILSNVFFVHGFSPYWINYSNVVPGGWSIAVEMTFYAITPWLFYKIKTMKHAFVFLCLALVFKLVLQEVFIQMPLISESTVWREFLFYYFPNQLPVFALGIILYFLITDVKSLHTVSKSLKILAFVLLLIQAGTTFDFLYMNHLVISSGMLLFCWLLSQGNLKFISNAFIRYIGKISFSLYLVHFVVIGWLIKFDWIDFSSHALINYGIRFMVLLFFSMLISSITYTYVEVPFQRLGSKLIRHLSTTKK